MTSDLSPIGTTPSPPPPRKNLLIDLQTILRIGREEPARARDLELALNNIKASLRAYYNYTDRDFYNIEHPDTAPYEALIAELGTINPRDESQNDRRAKILKALRIVHNLNEEDAVFLLGGEPVTAVAPREETPATRLETLLQLALTATEYNEALHMAFHDANVAFKKGIKEAVFNGENGYNAAALLMELPTVDTAAEHSERIPLHPGLFEEHLNRVLFELALM